MPARHMTDSLRLWQIFRNPLRDIFGGSVNRDNISIPSRRRFLRRRIANANHTLPAADNVVYRIFGRENYHSVFWNWVMGNGLYF